MANEWRHITVFDRNYPAEKQAEGIAVQEAVVEGHCNECGFLYKCSTDDSFRPPIFAWCTRRKHEIMKKWEENDYGHSNTD